jgi:hypothetical protein
VASAVTEDTSLACMRTKHGVSAQSCHPSKLKISRATGISMGSSASSGLIEVKYDSRSHR